MIDRLLCTLGFHFWVDDSDSYESYTGNHLRSRCCGLKRTFIERPEDWVDVPYEPHRQESYFDEGTLVIECVGSKMLDSKWWTKTLSEGMRWQRWNPCHFKNCGIGIRAIGSRYCCFHHRHIEVLHSIPVNASGDLAR
jgi:hypothetical protein